ncbi:MAG: hypothetical protein ACR2LI_00465 [Propionibacteriaceae bacterium]
MIASLQATGPLTTVIRDESDPDRSIRTRRATALAEGTGPAPPATTAIDEAAAVVITLT